MRTKHLFLALASITLALGFTACSSDEDKPIEPTPMKKSVLTFDADTIKVPVGETATLTIKDGGGDYKVINEDTTIASGKVNGNAVTVTSKKKGITGLVISDAAGNYKRVLVKSMYFKIELDKTDVAVTMKLGHASGTAKVTVTSGNGGYKWESKAPEVAKVKSITDDGVITVEGLSEGATEIVITDMMGLSQSISVKISVTNIPFTDEEKAEIMKSTTKIITWDDKKNWDGYGPCTVSEVGGKKLAGWNYYDYYFCLASFSGDLSVGKKTDGNLRLKFGWQEPETTYDDVDIEILKREGGVVWGIMSKLQDNYLHTGYFIVAERN